MTKIENLLDTNQSRYTVNGFGVFLFIAFMPFDAINKVDAIILAIPLVFGVIYILKHKKIYINEFYLYIFLFMLYVFSSFLWSTNKSIINSNILSFVSIISAFIFISLLKYSNKDEKLFKFGFIIAGTYVSLYAYFFGTTMWGRLYLTSNYLSADQNTLSGFLVIPIICCVDFMLTSIYTYRKKIIIFIDAIFMVSIILRTGSRGGLLAVFFGVLAYLLLTKALSITKKLVIVISFFSIFVLISIYFKDFLNGTMYSRFLVSEISKDSASGRFIIWKGLFNIIMSDYMYFLFGLGIGSTELALYREIGLQVVTHNLFLRIIFESGIIGFTLFFGFLIKVFTFSVKNKVHTASAIIIAMMTLSLSLDTFTYKNVWFSLFFAIILTRIEVNKNAYTKE